MKTTFQHALKISAVATVMACAGATHAADPVKDSYTQHYVTGTMLTDGDGKMYSNFPVQVLDIYELTNDKNPNQEFLAFCIEPTVELLQNTSYKASYDSEVSYGIKSLYETSFKSVFTSSATLSADDRKAAFQLALWDIEHDDGSMYVSGKDQYFTQSNGDPIVAEAERMLRLTDNYAVLNTYTYTRFNGTSGGVDSQQLLGASAVTPVPEAETWAMLSVGLGLMGLASRRKSRQSDKFTV